MNPIEYVESCQPISNIPDLISFQHNNPLGISPLVQLLIIFVLVEVMAFFNYKVRRCGKPQFYPALYAMFGIASLSVCYYCFQKLPDCYSLMVDGKMHNVLGWFCDPDRVRWGWTIVSIILLTHVVYSMLCAVMQITAQVSVDGKIGGVKPWKEWKAGLYISLVGILACGVTSMTYSDVADDWAIVITFVVFSLFTLVKMIADCVRSTNPLWGILIAIVFYFGMLSSMMLTIECLKGGIAVLVVILIVISRAKASKKAPKQK